jgi:C-terminal processing protease CtpA/Prc
MKYKNEEHKIIASDNKKKLTDENIIILINWGSASASEIFAWVIKDYVPNSILLWTKTFWKWSVQNLINYTDWSMFKYTVAKRYTGLSEKNIDHIWFDPDLKLEDNIKTEMDEVLEVAKIYNF